MLLARPRPRQLIIAAGAAAGVVLFDQGTKAIALVQLSGQERIPLLGDWFGLQLAFNAGTVMSIGSGSTWLLTILAVAAVVALTIAAARVCTPAWSLTIGLALGGALGNLLDRLFAPPGIGRGYVTDFLAYGNLFIGNFADVALGAAMAVGTLIYLRSRARRERVDTSESGKADY